MEPIFAFIGAFTVWITGTLVLMGITVRTNGTSKYNELIRFTAFAFLFFGWVLPLLTL